MNISRRVIELLVIVASLIVISMAVLRLVDMQNHTSLQVGNGNFYVRLALDDAARVKGLSGTNKLSDNGGLLMAFPGDDKWGIWMKDMKYPIDIVWIDSGKKVVDIAKNVPVNSYPQVFRPLAKSRYVLELSAGTVDSKAIKVNSKVMFNVNAKDVK